MCWMSSTIQECEKLSNRTASGQLSHRFASAFVSIFTNSVLILRMFFSCCTILPLQTTSIAGTIEPEYDQVQSQFLLGQLPGLLSLINMLFDALELQRPDVCVSHAAVVHKRRVRGGCRHH